MTDTVDRETRSRIMSSIRSSGTGPEVALRDAVRRFGLVPVEVPEWSPCEADLWFPGVAVLVDGDYWHSCPLHSKSAATDGWMNKLRSNVERDRRNEAELMQVGVIPVRAWECEIESCVEVVAKQVADLVLDVEAGTATVAGLAWQAGTVDGGGMSELLRCDLWTLRRLKCFVRDLRAPAELALLYAASRSHSDRDLSGAIASLSSDQPEPSARAAMALGRCTMDGRTGAPRLFA